VSALTAQADAVNPGGGSPRGWSITDYLLASVVDAVHVNTWVLQQVNSKTKVKPPTPLRRPGERVKAASRLAAADRERIRARNRGGRHGH